MGAFQLVAELVAAGRRGSVVTLLCDGGERYARTYYSDAWLAQQGLDLEPHRPHLERFTVSGDWSHAERSDAPTLLASNVNHQCVCGLTSAP